MNGESPILRVIARYAVPLTLLVAMQMFFQGHNAPGGGFVAGVLLAAAGAMYLLAFGIERLARVRWWRLSVFGLAVALINSTVPLLQGRVYLDNVTLDIGPLHLPTATFFDLGVLMIVVGTLMTIFIELAQERR